MAQAAIEEVPKTVGGLLLLLLGWFVGLRLTTAWDARKKRQEIDLATIQEFSRIVAEFKAIGRESELLDALGRKAAPGIQGIDVAAVRHELFKRAVEAESGLEVVLLKLLAETDSWHAAHSPRGIDSKDAVQREIRQFALLRLIFRNARERLSEASGLPPAFGEPAFWLFNRLAAETVKIIQDRAARPVFPPIYRLPGPHLFMGPDHQAASSAPYLKMIAYRTTDLNSAISKIKPALDALAEKRSKVRKQFRERNLKDIFVNETVYFCGSGTPVHAAAVVTVTQDNGNVPEDDIREAAMDFFSKNAATIEYYVSIADGPPRLIICQRGGKVRTLNETDRMPTGMPYRSGHTTAPPFAIDALRWPRTKEFEEAIEGIASVELT